MKIEMNGINASVFLFGYFLSKEPPEFRKNVMDGLKFMFCEGCGENLSEIPGGVCHCKNDE